MRAKKQNAPVWGFLHIAFPTYEALKAGEIDATECGPWIEEIEKEDGDDRQFLLNWNDFDPQFCDGVDGLTSAVEVLIVDALTDDHFRRCIAGVFYRGVVADLEAGFRCGDSVDEPVFRAYEAAVKACAAIDEQVECEVRLMRIIKTEERLANLAKVTRRCDRYIQLANKAYDRAADSCCQFGFEKNVEKFISRTAA